VWGGGVFHARPHTETFVNILLSRAFILKGWGSESHRLIFIEKLFHNNGVS